MNLTSRLFFLIILSADDRAYLAALPVARDRLPWAAEQRPVAGQFRPAPAWARGSARRHLYGSHVEHLVLWAVVVWGRVFWVALVIGAICTVIGALIMDRLERHGQESPSTVLLSSAHLTREELVAFLSELGALIPGKQRPYAGRLTYPGGYLWVRFAANAAARI